MVSALECSVSHSSIAGGGEMEKEEVVIGLETHVQLATRSKLFCSCLNTSTLKEEPEPNTHVCDVCLGMPGTKPMLNKEVISIGIKVALALNCTINKRFFFSRKTYFYPDMSKNYQITQYEVPLAENGYLNIKIGGKEKKIRIRRVHIEEDPAKIIHKKEYCLVDYNRAGIPLLEIVTEPDLSSPKEARLYLNKLEQILEYLDVYRSQSLASFKSDANISLKGYERVEIKNITGIKEVEQALSYEVLRQRNLIKRGNTIKRETRRWVEESKVTKSMRSKETEEDYGYIFDPDLPYVEINADTVKRIEREIPELPDEKEKRLIREYGIKEEIAEALISERDIADLFERCVKKGIKSKIAGTWVGVVLKKVLNYHNISLKEVKERGVKEEYLIDAIRLYQEGKYTDLIVEQIIRKIVEEGKSVMDIIRKYNYQEKRDSNLDNIIERIIQQNKKAVKDYLSGEEKALNFLVGMAMKETRGSVDPKRVREELIKKLKG